MPLLTRTGGAATFGNLEADIRTGLAAAGFTETILPFNANGNQISASYPGDGTTQYINILFNTVGQWVGFAPSFGQNAANNYDGQPRRPLNIGTTVTDLSRLRVIPPVYTNSWVFYAEPTANIVGYVHMVVETIPGSFKHASFGMLEKVGTWTGGMYSAAGSVDIDNDTTSVAHAMFMRPQGTITQTQSADWLAATGLPFTNLIGQIDSTGTGGTTDEFLVDEIWEYHQRVNDTTNQNFICQALLASGINQTNGVTPLIPIYCTAANSSAKYIMGTVPDCRYTSIEGLGNNVTLITVGADTWYVFPMALAGVEPNFTYNGPSSTVDTTGMFGYAYKLVP